MSAQKNRQFHKNGKSASLYGQCGRENAGKCLLGKPPVSLGKRRKGLIKEVAKHLPAQKCWDFKEFMYS